MKNTLQLTKNVSVALAKYGHSITSKMIKDSDTDVGLITIRGKAYKAAVSYSKDGSIYVIIWNARSKMGVKSGNMTEDVVAEFITSNIEKHISWLNSMKFVSIDPSSL